MPSSQDNGKEEMSIVFAAIVSELLQKPVTDDDYESVRKELIELTCDIRNGIVATVNELSKETIDALNNIEKIKESL